MHLPQSVLPNEGGGGAAAAVDSELGLVALDVSPAEADDPDAAGVGAPEPVGSAELAAAELSVAGLSGGLDSPPQASQAAGTTTMRTRAVRERWTRLMVLD